MGEFMSQILSIDYSFHETRFCYKIQLWLDHHTRQILIVLNIMEI